MRILAYTATALLSRRAVPLKIPAARSSSRARSCRIESTRKKKRKEGSRGLEFSAKPSASYDPTGYNNPGDRCHEEDQTRFRCCSKTFTFIPCLRPLPPPRTTRFRRRRRPQRFCAPVAKSTCNLRVSVSSSRPTAGAPQPRDEHNNS